MYILHTTPQSILHILRYDMARTSPDSTDKTSIQRVYDDIEPKDQRVRVREREERERPKCDASVLRRRCIRVHEWYRMWEGIACMLGNIGMQET